METRIETSNATYIRKLISLVVAIQVANHLNSPAHVTFLCRCENASEAAAHDVGGAAQDVESGGDQQATLAARGPQAARQLRREARRQPYPRRAALKSHAEAVTL